MTQYPDIRVRKFPSGKIDWWEVTEDCEVTNITGEKFIIEAGYISNFASVPRVFWSIIPPHGRSANASIVHDYMYEHVMDYRLLVDFFFFRNLLNDVPEWQAVLMATIVRLRGKKRWDGFKQVMGK